MCHLVDTAAVEKIEITGIHLDLILRNPILGHVLGVCAVRQMLLYFGTPNALVNNSVRTSAVISGVLYTDEACELMTETGDFKVEKLVYDSHMVDVWGVTVASVMDSKDCRSIETSIWLASHLDLFVNRQTR